jgi:L-alanine-DL-glutamate epimerase-like enolase superfamily enzyme
VTKTVAPSRLEAPVEGIAATAYTVPTESPESDGTLSWDETTVVIVEVEAGGVRGLGFSYTGEAAARVIDRRLAPAVIGRAAMDIPAAWSAMVAAVRNVGLPELAATAISAVDIALWDLKGRLLDLPLVTCLAPHASACRSTPAAASPPTTSKS